MSVKICVPILTLLPTTCFPSCTFYYMDSMYTIHDCISKKEARKVLHYVSMWFYKAWLLENLIPWSRSSLEKGKGLGLWQKKATTEISLLNSHQETLAYDRPWLSRLLGMLVLTKCLLLNKGQQWTFNSVLQHILLWHQFVLLTVSMPYYKIQATYTEELWLITLLKSIL